MSTIDTAKAADFVQDVWEDTIVPSIEEYIRIPNKSPHFDPDWEAHGYMDQAVDLIRAWCERREIAGLTVEVVRLPGRTPVIFMEIPGASEDTVLLYGHLDKQPEFVGWEEGLGPWKPVRRGDLLYGRGGADDGYAAFASLTAIEALQRQGVPHGRCVVLIEACEESGSYDLPFYIDALAERIGSPQLVVCLDSGCGNYDQLWCTTSLRGIAIGKLSVEILREGVHSGDASGIVPDSFRILRELLDRVEDPRTGEIRCAGLLGEIPDARRTQAARAADVLGAGVHTKFPFVEGAGPADQPLTELVLNRTWRPTLSLIGMDGVPAGADAGNVLRPGTTATLSVRVPPNVDANAAGQALKRDIERDPPYGARVELELGEGGNGWDAPALADWLEASADAASKAVFGREAVYMGEGGSIPFMGMLGEKFPEAQFLITGVLGPASNAHGPNEFLHVPMGISVTRCVSHVLADHYRHFAG